MEHTIHIDASTSSKDRSGPLAPGGGHDTSVEVTVTLQSDAHLDVLGGHLSALTDRARAAAQHLLRGDVPDVVGAAVVDERTDQERYAPTTSPDPGVAAGLREPVVTSLQAQINRLYETVSRIQRDDLVDLDKRVDMAHRRLDAISAPAGAWLEHAERQAPSAQSQFSRAVLDLGLLACDAPWERMASAVEGTVIDAVPGAAPCDDAVLAASGVENERRRWFTPDEWRVVSGLDGIPF